MVIQLSGEDARRIRWRSQLLGGSDLLPADVVNRAVALQGQDLPAVLRAVALRSRPGTTVPDVRAAFDGGVLVRSWPMRGTLFVTTPEHLAALLFFTAERVHRATARNREELGLDDRTVAHARDVLLEALEKRPLSRAEALSLWDAAGIGTAGGPGYRLLLHLAVAGHVHWGAFHPDRPEQLLTLSPGLVPADPEAALAQIVRGFVLARGPVTEADLAWWTKLPRTVLRRAAATVEDLTTVEVDGVPAWIIGAPPPAEPTGAVLLPGFDEWILGYADRSLTAGPAMLDAIVPGRNGVFRPVVVVDGVTVGTWRLPRTTSRAKSEPVVELLERVPAAARRAIDQAVAAWPHG
ncbi:winged helix DNA-binding domain-containing protein [Arthrobacter gengyunqii]|uniref:Winged helix DNA-binding domain-containing protein n=1 Tax=Arthrobacter gengyunqii TaxID=2886940 RepID=A0A9X1M025_9MICC|nr:crosslink repair DNA glycosylase YcaQ family protein [Arthrobacter gengyunqii]MCC3268898.1 winged helix DNA-binding domain-containing protein [Arthrobacter gengyunqii]UOY96278.1 winged helix DNA-binding domain-containing protein [Arthrobacter gengyunqii]